MTFILGQTAWNKNKKWSKETIQKISNSRKGISAWNKGKPWSLEVKQKISKAKKGSKAWNKGKKWGDEVKKKISQTKKLTYQELKENQEISLDKAKLD